MRLGVLLHFLRQEPYATENGKFWKKFVCTAFSGSSERSESGNRNDREDTHRRIAVDVIEGVLREMMVRHRAQALEDVKLQRVSVNTVSDWEGGVECIRIQVCVMCVCVSSGGSQILITEGRQQLQRLGDSHPKKPLCNSIS